MSPLQLWQTRMREKKRCCGLTCKRELFEDVAILIGLANVCLVKLPTSNKEHTAFSEGSIQTSVPCMVVQLNVCICKFRILYISKGNPSAIQYFRLEQ